MDLFRAIVVAAAAGEPELRRAYRAALARGASNTGCTREEERCYGALRLLTLALLRLPDLSAAALLLHLVDGDEDPVIASTVADVAAGALRLAHRALEVHGRDVGYETGAWIDVALLEAGAQLGRPVGSEGSEVPVALEQARAAAVALTRAAAATAADRMLVAARLADGLGHLLALFVIARRAAE